MKPTHFRTGNGIDLVGDLRGGASPKVIFLHGGGQSRHAWRSSAELLSERGICSLALDLRGHGDSSWSDEGDYRLDSYVEDLRAIIAQFGDTPVALVGASLGGLVALKMGAHHPQIVERIVLIDVTPRHRGEGGEQIKRFLRSGASGFASIDDASRLLSNLMNTDRPRSAAGLARYMRQETDGRFYWKWDPRFIDERYLGGEAQDDQLVEAARAVRAPTLLIRAANSNVVRLEDVEDFRTIMPHADIVEVPGVRHMVTGDNNAIYTEAMFDFVC